MSTLLTPAEFAELYMYLSDKERFGPGPARGRINCDHTLYHTVAWLQTHSVQDIKANVEKIIDLDGLCDCEVLLNVNPSTWVERSSEDIAGPGLLGEREWEQFVSDTLRASGYEERPG